MVLFIWSVVHWKLQLMKLYALKWPALCIFGVYIISHWDCNMSKHGSICHFKRVRVIQRLVIFSNLNCNMPSWLFITIMLRSVQCRFMDLDLTVLFYFSLDDFWMFRLWLFNCIHDAYTHTQQISIQIPFDIATFKLNRNLIQYYKRFHAENSSIASGLVIPGCFFLLTRKQMNQFWKLTGFEWRKIKADISAFVLNQWFTQNVKNKIEMFFYLFNSLVPHLNSWLCK